MSLAVVKCEFAEYESEEPATCAEFAGTRALECVGYTDLESQVAMATAFSATAPRILRWLLDFCKICGPEM
jgi:hypothetical protein